MSKNRNDDPELRQLETTLELAAGGKPISKLRLTALKHAHKMPWFEESIMPNQS